MAYTVVWLKPSWHCGPFSDFNPMYKVFTSKLMKLLPRNRTSRDHVHVILRSLVYHYFDGENRNGFFNFYLRQSRQ